MQQQRAADRVVVVPDARALAAVRLEGDVAPWDPDLRHDLAVVLGVVVELGLVVEGVLGVDGDGVPPLQLGDGLTELERLLPELVGREDLLILVHASVLLCISVYRGIRGCEKCRISIITHVFRKSKAGKQGGVSNRAY